MLFAAVTLSVLLPVTLATAVGRVEKRACHDVHLFLARGNGEPYPGRVGAISDTVCSGLPSCDYENIMFNSNQDYCSQASDGVDSGNKQVAAYAAACPNSKLVLAGYSLGAMIVGDMLGGGGGNFYNCQERSSSGLASTSSASHIAAVLMFGDVRHVANQGYNYGPGSGHDGQYPRSGSSLSNLNQFSQIMRSYCLLSDPICAMGPDGYSHTTYMTVYATDAGYWAQGVLGFAEPGSGTVVQPPSQTSSSAQQQNSPTPTSSSAPTSAASSDEGSSGESSSVTFSVPRLSSASATVSSSSSESSSSTTSSTSSSTTSYSSVPINTSTFAPFVFSSQTSTFSSSALHSTILSSIQQTSTRTAFAVVTPTTAPTTSSTPVATSSSKAGAYANNAAGLTLNFVTLVVIKALVF